jgi:LmbE family N-acetylglucosaminyl deacetylase
MTEEDETSGTVPRPVRDLVVQWREMTERLAALSGLGGLVQSLPSTSALPSLPRPASLSAAQMKAITTTVAAQHRSIEAMQEQLRAFDEQLTVIEKILEPLTEWVTVWADVEDTVMGRPSPPDE